jgi:hypothetical protein
MTTFPNAPKLVRGGLVAIDAATSRVLRVIPFQYNPDTVTRTLQPRGAGTTTGDRLEALRLTGPPQETIKVEAEFDATDALEHPEQPQNQNVGRFGLFPQLAALETLIYPSSARLAANDAESRHGVIEIAPVEAPLILFVWSRSRIVPVRLTEFSVTEEAFDTSLNPTRARVSLGMRVLTVNDLGLSHRGGAISQLHHQQLERFAAMQGSAALGSLGITGIPGS